MYKVTSTVFPRNCPEAKTEVVVWKRFKEFQKLFKELKTRHEKLYLKDEFPSFSKPRLFGRFESDVIEERRLAAQTLLDFIARHPPLFTSQSCVKFFEQSQSVTPTEEIKSCRHKSQLTLPLSPSVLGENDKVLSRSSSHSTLTDSESSMIGSPSKDVSKARGNSSALDDSSSLLPSNQECLESSDIPKEPHLIHIVEGTNNLLLDSIPTINESSTAGPPCLQNSQGESSKPQAFPGISSEDSFDAESKTQKSESTSELFVMDYITQAGYHVSQAVQHETNSSFELAFASYKAAISCLLNGVEDDSSDDMKTLVQRKTSQYLRRAEQIYHTHLEGNHNTTRTIPETTDVPRIQETAGGNNPKSLEAPIGDLKFYKVLGVVSSVILALNTSFNTPYIIKVLHKSSFPVDRRIKSIVPRNVPFMCRLHNYMENERAVFLILEQARGGCLWDHISPYFEIYHTDGSRKAFDYFLNVCATESTQENQINKVQKEEVLNSGMHCGISLNLSSSRSIATVDRKIKLEKHIIPDIITQETPSSSKDLPQTRSCCAPDVLPTKHPTASLVETDFSSDTSDILKNSQNLLNSVSSTLSKSEEATKALLHSKILPVDKALHNLDQEGTPVNCNSSKVGVGHISLRTTSVKYTSNGRLSSATREKNRSTSREGLASASRRSRSRIRYSCDDMFEGRARALSKSLDREALHRVDSCADQSPFLGLPVDTVRLWAAQLLLALDALHRWGVVIGDLRPDNLLLGEGLNLVLTYQCEWVCVDRIVHPEAVEQLYAAPEMSSIQAKTTAADWWSYGAILFGLLSGETLLSCHPGGFHSYTTLHIPDCVCEDGKNLLRQLLQFEPHKRLGVGPHGIARLRSHSFFKGVEWNKVLILSASH